MSVRKEAVIADVCDKVCVGFVGTCGKYYCDKDQGVPMIRTTNIKDNGIDYTGMQYISYEFHEKNIKSQLIKGDILIARHGENGRAAMYKASERANCLNAIIVRTNEKVLNKDFLLYFLNDPNTRGEIKARSSGSVQDVINTKQIALLPIPLPPLPEQKVIASVLSSLDDKIDLLHRQNKTLEAMAETLFRQWFVEEADDSWEDGTISDEFDFTMGQSPPGSSFNEDGNGTPMFQGNADFSFRFPERRVYTTEPKRFAEKYDTLISVRAPVGAQNMAYEKCCIGRGVAAFRYKKNNDFYTYTYYKLMSLMDEIKIFNDEGTVFGSIGKKDFENMVISIPHEIRIEEFENIIKPINDKIITNSIQIKTLESKRDLLLPKLMSGEVRVG